MQHGKRPDRRKEDAVSVQTLKETDSRNRDHESCLGGDVGIFETPFNLMAGISTTMYH